MRMMIGGLLTSLNSSGTMSGVAPRDDNSRKKVRNVRGDSSAILPSNRSENQPSGWRSSSGDPQATQGRELQGTQLLA